MGPFIVRGHRTVMVADTGHGKTTLAMQLAAAVLTGAEALGYTGVGAGPILVVDLEQGIRSIKRILREAGLARRDDVLYLSVQDGLALDADDAERGDIERILREHRPAVLLLDPYYKAHRADANEERAVVDLMRYLDRLRAEYGFALLLPAHPRKDAGSNGPRKLTIHDVAGSGAVTRGAELVLALERLSHGYARLRFLKDRDFDLPVGETRPLTFSRGDGFQLDAKEQQTSEELEQQILADTGEWRTVKDWAGLLHIREGRANDLLERLAEAERIEKEIGPPGRAHNARCYRNASPGARAKQGEAVQKQLGDLASPASPASIRRSGAGEAAGAGSATGEAAVDEDEIERLAELAREAQA
jgi:hypothetical protein